MKVWLCASCMYFSHTVCSEIRTKGGVILEFILRFVLVDIPEAFLLLTIGLAIFNISVLKEVKRALLFSLLFSASGELLSFYDVSYQPKILLMFVCTSLFLYVIYRNSIVKTVFMSTASICSLIMAEFILYILLNSQQIYLKDIMSTATMQNVVSAMYLFVLFLFAFILRISKLDIRRMLPRNQYNRYLFLLILVGSIEFLLILFMNTSFFIRGNNSSLFQLYTPHFQMVFQVMILALFIVIVLLFRVYISLTINRVEEETGTPYMKSIHDMGTAIRSIKHDSLNHYTAINGFLKKGLYDMGKEYVEQLLHETVMIEKTANSSIHVLDRIKNPAVSSLLQSKMAVCMAERITLTMNFTGSHEFSHFKTYDLIKVLGNLFDNAIRAASYELEENRYIRLDWGQTHTEQYLQIENSGPTIPSDKLPNIFQLGYTTKKQGEGGVGLAVVKTVIERYGGKISVRSEDGITSFRISFINR